MSQHNEQKDPLAKVVLVVPAQHVKTVKSALERCGQLDRASKIAPEPNKPGQPPQPADHDTNTHESPVAVPQPRNQHRATSSPGTTQFPALQFDLASGEYRDLADMHQASTLQFDKASGQYKALTTLSQFPDLHFHTDNGQDGKPANSQTFPRLQFDEVTGEYQSPAEPKQPQALEFDATSGEYRPKTELQETIRENDPIEQRMRIPTTIPYEDTECKELGQQRNAAILDTLCLSHLFQNIEFSHSAHTTPTPTAKCNPLHSALLSTLQGLQHILLDPLDLDPASLVSHFPDSYTLYQPMLLLPHTTFSSPPWQTLLSAHPPSSPTLQPLWQNLAKAVNATHIALNSPIPLQTQLRTPSPNSNSSSLAPNSTTGNDNILRIPLNITPLFGNFGPTPTPRSLATPTASDFAQAFWVHTTQHGIHQTWAPLYTMFSRGNITEKARVAALATEDVSSSLSREVTAAADLYAGIGYFAFSYRKAGVKPVICWELNPWSVEGLRRGARLNRWTVQVRSEDDASGAQAQTDLAPGETADSDFIVFPMSNACAVTVLPHLGEVGARVRRVNLGLLPSSEKSWETAVRILLRSQHEASCWIHAHENVAVGDIKKRTGEVEAEFQRLVDRWGGEGERKQSASVRHVERVKMYAPGVAHCVFDVYIGGV